MSRMVSIQSLSNTAILFALLSACSPAWSQHGHGGGHGHGAHHGGGHGYGVHGGWHGYSQHRLDHHGARHDYGHKLDEYVKKNPDTAYTHFLRGYHFGFLGKNEYARKELARAIELESRDTLAVELLNLFGGEPTSDATDDTSSSKNTGTEEGHQSHEGHDHGDHADHTRPAQAASI